MKMYKNNKCHVLMRLKRREMSKCHSAVFSATSTFHDRFKDLFSSLFRFFLSQSILAA